MALTDKEKQIIQWGKDNGKSLTETKAALANYRNTVQEEPEVAEEVQPERSFLDKASDVSEKILKFTGGEKIAESLGSHIARGTFGQTVQQAVTGRDLSPEEEATIEGPGVKEVAGDALRTGALFTPIGRVAGVVGKGLTKLGLGYKAAKVGGEIAGGATAGVAADVGVSLAEGQDPQIGYGTALGAGIPAASPIVGAIARTSAKWTGKGAAEVSGALTGTSAETLEQAFAASKAGGKELDSFTAALRGQTTPEALVENFQTNIGKVSTQRQQMFKETLAELSDEVVNTAPAKQGFVETLNKFKVDVDENGLLNFSRSELRTVPAAQSKIQQAWSEIVAMPEQMPISDLDTTRQAVKAIKSIAGDDPSSNKANALIEDAVRSIRGAGEQVDGYGAMLDNFAETSQFLDELQRGLSSGDRATVDQTYRRMATALKTNNEQRMALVRELDAATDGAILSEISGQQLSEIMPRGIFRQIAAGIAGGAAISGGVTPTLLPALVFASPKVTGEFVRSLGIGTAKAEIMIESIAEAREVLLKAGIITGAELGVEDGSNLEQ